MRLLSLMALAGLLVLIPDPAWASDKPAAEHESKGLKTDNNVELPMLVAPVSVDGHLYHYAYMRVILTASSSDMVDKANDKIPFILDAMLRETHRATLALDNDPKQIDGDGLKTRLLGVANTVMGAGAFTALAFRDTIQTDDPSAALEEHLQAEAAPPPAAEPEHGKPAE